MSKSTWILIAISWIVWAFAGAWVGDPTRWHYAFSVLYWIGAMVIIIRVTRKGEPKWQEPVD